MWIDRQAVDRMGEFDNLASNMQCKTANQIKASQMSSGKLLKAGDLFLGPDAIVCAKETSGLSPNISDSQIELNTITRDLTGRNVLVLLPTGNKQKAAILKAMFPTCGTNFIFVNLKGIDSGVGEQPYNSAGPQGTMNRIAASLKSFTAGSTHLGSAESYCKDNGIGKIMVASIENYIEGSFTKVGQSVQDQVVTNSAWHAGNKSNTIQCEKQTLEHATDYGLVALYDVVSGKLIAAHSKGVKIPLVKAKTGELVDFVAIAMSKGFVDGQKEHGSQTVGKVIQALVDSSPGTVNSIDGQPYKINANWHADVVGDGIDRYSLLHEAVQIILRQGIDQGIYDI